MSRPIRPGMRGAAARGTYDRLSELHAGQLMIRGLKRSGRQREAAAHAWKQFHDAFLSYGGPPIPLDGRR